MTKSTGDDWLGVPALAKELGSRPARCTSSSDAGAMTSYKMGRVIRVKRADVDAYLKKVKVGPGDLAHPYRPGEDGDAPRKR